MARVMKLFPALALLCAPLAAVRAGDEEAEKPADEGAEAAEVVRSFDRLDGDGDGKISKAEFPLPELFAKLDADKDGYLTREEASKAATAKPRPPGKKEGDEKDPVAKTKRRTGPDPRRDPDARVQEILRGFDGDKDGKVAKAEYPGKEADAIFRKFDRNDDGFLEGNELVALAKDQIEDLKKARQHPRRDQFMYLFDEDGDQKVTKEEYDGPASPFKQYDVNGDGVVAYDELIYPERYKKGAKEGAREATGAAAEDVSVWELYDKNKDKRVTKEEWGGSEAVFRRLDRNSDGVLTILDV